MSDLDGGGLILGKIWRSLGLKEFCDQLTVSHFEGKLGEFSDYGFTREQSIAVELLTQSASNGHHRASCMSCFTS